MKLTRVLTGIGALALVALLLDLVAPKALHAAAALVLVTNTAANSVPTSDAGMAAEPFSWEGSSSSGQSSFAVPATTADGRTIQRLVIEHVTTACFNVSSPNTGIRVVGFPFSAAGVSGAVPEFFIPFAPSPNSAQQMLSQPARIYVDPGATVALNGIPGNGACSFSVFGHLNVQ